jgi:hypothetical protein
VTSVTGKARRVACLLLLVCTSPACVGPGLEPPEQRAHDDGAKPPSRDSGVAAPAGGTGGTHTDVDAGLPPEQGGAEDDAGSEQDASSTAR